jgi:hypothetical protein
MIGMLWDMVTADGRDDIAFAVPAEGRRQGLITWP